MVNKMTLDQLKGMRLNLKFRLKRAELGYTYDKVDEQKVLKEYKTIDKIIKEMEDLSMKENQKYQNNLIMELELLSSKNGMDGVILIYPRLTIYAIRYQQGDGMRPKYDVFDTYDDMAKMFVIHESEDK